MPRSPGSTRRSAGERHGACEDRHDLAHIGAMNVSGYRTYRALTNEHRFHHGPLGWARSSAYGMGSNARETNAERRATEPHPLSTFGHKSGRPIR
jgi:hypothetical protein